MEMRWPHNLTKIKICLVPDAQEFHLPEHSTKGASGFDLRAKTDAPIILYHGESCLVQTGIKLAIPEGYEGQVRPRSGLAIHWGITVVNTPGTIDSDYRGEIGVILINHGKVPFTIENGDRIAQLVIQEVPTVAFELVEDLSDTSRGDGGFGSTGSS